MGPGFFAFGFEHLSHRSPVVDVDCELTLSFRLSDSRLAHKRCVFWLRFERKGGCSVSPPLTQFGVYVHLKVTERFSERSDAFRAHIFHDRVMSSVAALYRENGWLCCSVRPPETGEYLLTVMGEQLLDETAASVGQRNWRQFVYKVRGTNTWIGDIYILIYCIYTSNTTNI